MLLALAQGEGSLVAALFRMTGRRRRRKEKDGKRGRKKEERRSRKEEAGKKKQERRSRTLTHPRFARMGSG
jgi:hypothetical protein